MKLSGWTIILLGLCLGLSVLSYALFQVYLPNEQAKTNNDEVRALLEAEANKQGAADRRVVKAMEKVNAAADSFNLITASKTPSTSLATGGINLNTNNVQLVVDSRKYRNNAQRAFNAQVRKGGVKIVSAPEIPMPGDDPMTIGDFYNYPALPFPVVVWELGSVTVTGTYQQIMRNVRDWKNMPHYLAVADGLSITGTSPNLTGTYNVTLVGFMKAPQLFPAPPVIVASGSGSAGGGAVQGGGGARPGGANAAGGTKPAPGAARP